MPALPTAEWTDSLDRMTASLSRAIEELDRSIECDAAPAESAANSPPASRLFDWLERRLGEWDGKLRDAEELASAVEQQLTERESALLNWHELFGRWRELIQRNGDHVLIYDASTGG